LNETEGETVANSKSAEKRNRQNEKRREHNRVIRSRIRTYTNKFEEALESGDKDAAQEAYQDIVSALDRAARKNVIPKERASRKKGRMAKRLDALD
jgi:small subunit ribosomal protein S20